MTHHPKHYSIKAGEATGLSSSLRIWELRYGWPRPLRKENTGSIPIR